MKLVGLVPVRNAAETIAQCLKALALLCDEIVVLDDCSDDRTVEVVKQLAVRCKIKTVLTKDNWHRDEPGDRNRLLQEGRRLGGTHFAVIDADEIFTAGWVVDGSLRKKAAALDKGGRLYMRWIHPWRSLDYVRWDDSIQTQQFKDIIFCDDGIASYESDFIHTQRSPHSLNGTEVRSDNVDEGLLHFQYLNWRNVLIKQAWYHCLERVREPKRPIKTINTRYKASCDETGLQLRPLPEKWLQGYDPIEREGFDIPDSWRLKQMMDWLREYGIDYFRRLNIWDPELWLSPIPEIAALLQPVRAKVQIANSAAAPAVASQQMRSELTKLKQQFKEVELDRVERGKVIEQQGRMLAKLEREFDVRLKELKQLYASAEALKNERNLFQAQLADLQKNFSASEKDRADRLNELGKLAATVDTLQNERNLLLAKLADLQKNFTACEKDREDRGNFIESQGRTLSRLEADFDARLKELRQLYMSLETLKNERNLLQTQLTDLQKNFDAAEADRLARGQAIEQQGRRVSELEGLVWLTEQDRDYWKKLAEPPLI